MAYFVRGAKYFSERASLLGPGLVTTLFLVVQNFRELLHLLENTFDRKRISVNPNPNSSPNLLHLGRFCIIFAECYCLKPVYSVIIESRHT